MREPDFGAQTRPPSSASTSRRPRWPRPAGLTVPSLRESDEIPWLRWQHMVPGTDGFRRLPDDAPRIPLIYALLVAE